MKNFIRLKACMLAFFIINCSGLVFGQDTLDAHTLKLEEISMDTKYGYKPLVGKSIKVGSIDNQIRYINALTGPNGEKVYAERLESCCPFNWDKAVYGTGYLDKWQIIHSGLRKPIILYLNGYEYDNPKCPIGLDFKKEADIQKVVSN